MSELVVMKFGGTSVGSAKRMGVAAKIVAGASKNVDVVVVTSAMATVTDLLVSATNNASNRKLSGLKQDLQKIREIHSKAITELELPREAREALQGTIDSRLEHLRRILESVSELGEPTARAKDLILSFGERMSVHLLSQALLSCGVASEPVEATDLIVTTDHFGNAMPRLEESRKKARPVISAMLKKKIVPVVTGYIGATEDGLTTTFGRGGSDYSATILGYCLDADKVLIWTDVNGVMSTDPRIVPEARTIDELSYNEAAELSYFGAKVLHPLTIVPASLKQIPVWIKNTFEPDHPGTRISTNGDGAKYGGKAISSMKGLSMITIQGRGVLGVSGMAGRVFSAMATNDVPVLFISQASSEFNISFVTKADQGKKAINVLREVFRFDLADRSIEAITLDENLAILVLVGEGMKGQVGVSGRLFSAVAKSGVNIIAVAQGSSELNISLVIHQDSVSDAVASIHQAFGMSKKARHP